MKKLLASCIVLCTLIFGINSSFANTTEEETSADEPTKKTLTQGPFISMNIGIELAGLEKAAEEAAQGVTLIGESLESLANNPDLTPEQHEIINQALGRVDNLSQSLSTSMEQLPATVEKSLVPVVEANDDLSRKIKQIIIITSIALVLIILVTLIAVYYFVLAPGTRSVIKTAKLLDDLANTLKTTAEIVEKSSDQNLQVMEEIRKMQQIPKEV